MNSTYKLCCEVGDKLTAAHLVLALAESCTGGGLAESVTDVPGASVWFDRSIVTYSNAAKMQLLGVTADTLTQHGAVSSETAEQMAQGLLNTSSADVVLSITGIAGPGGGSVEKPVGTVWFGVGLRGDNIQTYLQHFSGDRNKIRSSAIDFALNLLINIVSID